MTYSNVMNSLLTRIKCFVTIDVHVSEEKEIIMSQFFFIAHTNEYSGRPWRLPLTPLSDDIFLFDLTTAIGHVVDPLSNSIDFQPYQQSGYYKDWWILTRDKKYYLSYDNYRSDNVRVEGRWRVCHDTKGLDHALMQSIRIILYSCGVILPRQGNQKDIASADIDDTIWTSEQKKIMYEQ